MTLVEFSKFSPGGNETLFVCGAAPRAAASAAFASIGAEQWGFADAGTKTLVMGGGEFCVNAARAFGALMDMRSRKAPADAPRVYVISVSGWPGPLRIIVRGGFPRWRVTADMDLPFCPVEILDRSHRLVHLPGIRHLLCFDDADIMPDRDAHARDAESRRRRFRLEDSGALGVIACRANGSDCAVLPYVVVPQAGTAMIESCCGSAALALALALHQEGRRGKLRVRQPASALEAEIRRTARGLRASISGPVDFMMSGVFNAAEDSREDGECAG